MDDRRVPECPSNLVWVVSLPAPFFHLFTYLPLAFDANHYLSALRVSVACLGRIAQ